MRQGSCHHKGTAPHKPTQDAACCSNMRAGRLENMRTAGALQAHSRRTAQQAHQRSDTSSADSSAKRATTRLGLTSTCPGTTCSAQGMLPGLAVMGGQLGWAGMCNKRCSRAQGPPHGPHRLEVDKCVGVGGGHKHLVGGDLPGPEQVFLQMNYMRAARWSECACLMGVPHCSTRAASGAVAPAAACLEVGAAAAHHCHPVVQRPSNRRAPSAPAAAGEGGREAAAQQGARWAG